MGGGGGAEGYILKMACPPGCEGLNYLYFVFVVLFKFR